MARSQFIDLLDGYEESNGRTHSLGKRFFVREISGAMTQEKKRRVSSRRYMLAAAFSRLITYTKARVWGAGVFSFGAVVALIHLTLFYLGISEQVTNSTIAVSVSACVIGLILMLFDKPVSVMLQENGFFDFIFFEFFCIQRVHRKSDESSLHIAVTIVLGVLLALSTCFISPFYIALGLLTLLFTSITIHSPEFAYIASLLILPYLSIIPAGSYVFGAMLILCTLGFARKVSFGKRVISFEHYDALLLFMMLFVFLSGVFMQGTDSFAASLTLCFLTLGYFLTSSIITNRRLADRTMNAVVVSSVPLSIGAIVTYGLSSVRLGHLAHPCATGFFESSAVFATFLLIAFFFSMAHTSQTHAPLKKIPYSVSAVLNLIAIFTTGEVFAVAALLLGIIYFFVSKIRKTPLLITAISLLFILPFSVFLFPSAWLEKIYAFIPSAESLEAVKSTLLCSLSEILRNPFLGIGVGADAFAAKMLSHGVTATDSGNLLIEIALEMGIFALFAFVILIISRIRHRIVYSQYVRISVVKHSQPIVASAVCALLFYGFYDYIFADFTMFYLFFVLFAVESAMLRVSRRARDERILYYEDSRSNDSSSIDVSLAEESE